MFSLTLLKISNFLYTIWCSTQHVLVGPGTYLCAMVYCLVELVADLFFTPNRSDRIKKWQRSTLFQELHYDSPLAVLTGADGCIGKEVMEVLLELGFDVAIFGLCRPISTSAKHQKRVHFFECNFLDLHELQKAVLQFGAKFTHVEIAVFCAGTMLHPPILKPNAIDPHYLINLFAHAFLFHSLKSYMEKSNYTSSRTVVLSSATNILGMVTQFIYGNPEIGFRNHINGYKSYADSKLYVILYFRYLAKMLKTTKLRIVTVHPGVVPGTLYRHVFAPIRWCINYILKYIVRKKALAADKVLDLVFDNNLHSGHYYDQFGHTNYENYYNDAELSLLYQFVEEELEKLLPNTFDNSPSYIGL